MLSQASLPNEQIQGLLRGVAAKTMPEARFVSGGSQTIASEDIESVQRALQTMRIDEGKFTALWSAIHGSPNVVVAKRAGPPQKVWIANTASGDRTSVLPATIIVVEDGAEASVVESYTSAANQDEILSCAATLILVGDNARLDYAVVQNWGPNVWHFATHRATLGRDAKLNFFGATFGSKLQKVYWEAILNGAGAEAQIDGVCFGDGEQHLDHQSLQAHRAMNTTSDLLLNVAVRDKARSVYSGLIEVAHEAQKTNGYVKNRNLILSHGATADSIPRLEIKANDVRCTHGSTVGHIDPEQLFYLESRGVSAQDAERIIVRGFMEEALARCVNTGMREYIGTLLDEETAGHAIYGAA